jgi:ABC-2 type transport system ATP-binding protein
VLALDEPANGLDPAGIRWMRDLLRDYARRGGTVLLSSHLLHEVEQIADDIVVIGRGRIVASAAKSELLARVGTFVHAADDDRLAAALRAAGTTVSPSGDGLVAEAEPARVGEAAHAAGVPLVELRPSGTTGLEDLFLRLTADSQRDPVTTASHPAAETTGAST